MKRQYVIALVALAALLGSLLTVYGTQQERDFLLRGYVDPSQDANLPFRVPRLGVNVDLTQYTASTLPQQLELMESAHVTWVRQIFPWDNIEPEQGRYNWENWDRIVNAIDENPDLQLVAVLMFTPSWARTELSPDQRTSPPGDPADFATFAAEFAVRYGETIDYYQVWDEPNLTETWGGMEPRPVDYTALLQEAYTAIHAADADASVIAGALAPTTEVGPNNISDILYLRDLYTLGAQHYMDGVGAKPYGFSTPPDDRTIDPNVLNFSRVVALREEMVRNGDGKKAIWAMNWGWNSLSADWSGRPSIWGNVTAAEQANYSLAALDRAEREWPWLAGMILQLWQPVATTTDPIWGFALIDQQNTPTALYRALVNRPPALAAENGLFPATTPYARYSGVWTFGKMGADIGWIQDSQLDFEFMGRSVSLLLRQDEYTAYLYPTIDGTQANAAPQDASGNAYIILSSGSARPETNLVPVATGLSQQKHTLHLIADRGWDRWALAGFGVSSGDLTAPYNNKLAVAWIAVAISFVSTFVAGWQIDSRALFQLLSALNSRLSYLGQLAIGSLTSLALLLGMFLTWGEGTPLILRRESTQLGLAILTAGIIYLEPGFILTVVAAAILLILIYNRTDLGLMLTLFWVPFFLFPVELYRFAFPLAEILILLTTIAWALRLFGTWGRKRQAVVSQFNRPSPFVQIQKITILDFCILAFALLGIASLSWAALRDQAITELRVMIIEPALFYLIFRTLPPDKKLILRLVDTLMLAGLFVAAIGLWQFIQGEAVITAEAGARRLASVYGSPNNVGLFLGRCIPFALAFLLAPIDRNRRIFAAISLAIMGFAVILSQSVGAIFIGVPAAMIAVSILMWGRRARLVLVGLVGIVTVAFLLSLQSARFARVLDFDSGTNFYRIRVWQSAINVIRDHPITGLGLDQFLYAFRGRYMMPDAWQEPNLSHPHNILLDFWVRLGLLGVALLFAIQIAFWKGASRVIAIYRAKDPILYAIAVGAVGSMVNLLSHGLIDNSVFVQDLSYIFIFLLALSVQLSNTSAIDVAPL